MKTLRIAWLASLLLQLLIAAWFYLNYRPLVSPEGMLNWSHWLPSVLLVGICFSVLKLTHQASAANIRWLVLGLGAIECAEISLLPGVFAPSDLLAIVLAGAICWFFRDQRISFRQSAGRPALLASLGLGMLLSLGSYPELWGEYYDWCDDPEQAGNCLTPVYMSYDELRAPVELKQEISAPAVTGGKLYLYQSHLFVSDPQWGLTIWNVSVPESPEFVGTLTIPANTDIAIRNGTLYANSHRDLVSVDLDDPSLVASRIEDVFPEVDYWGMLPWEYELTEFIDHSQGALIGYEALNGDWISLSGERVVADEQESQL